MKTEPAVRFDSVSKRFKFKTNQANSVLDSIVSTFSRSNKVEVQYLWALKESSFEIFPGECVGFVGRNGSGKSTILKLTSGIIRPTTGRVEVRGRLSALLELGAGFHPDLTGQENIGLNASILGISNAEVAEVYDDIVEFAELGEFINMPVKHYSSGMYMRLGFSVAVHVDPDVVLIDEILAVGDQSFQEKSIERLFQLRDAGTTIIFVSHNLESVRALCSRLIWIDDGRVKQDGPMRETIEQYLMSYDGMLPVEEGLILPQRWGSAEIELNEIRVLNAAGEVQGQFEVGELMIIEMDYVSHQPVEEPVFRLSFYRDDGTNTGEPEGQLTEGVRGTVLGSGVMRCQIKHLPFMPAGYSISTHIFDAQTESVYDHLEKAGSFIVVTDPAQPEKGQIDIPATWEALSQTSNEMIETSVDVRELMVDEEPQSETTDQVTS